MGGTKNTKEYNIVSYDTVKKGRKKTWYYSRLTGIIQILNFSQKSLDVKKISPRYLGEEYAWKKKFSLKTGADCCDT